MPDVSRAWYAEPLCLLHCLRICCSDFSQLRSLLSRHPRHCHHNYAHFMGLHSKNFLLVCFVTLHLTDQSFALKEQISRTTRPDLQFDEKVLSTVFSRHAFIPLSHWNRMSDLVIGLLDRFHCNDWSCMRIATKQTCKCFQVCRDRLGLWWRA